ncbi:MAG: transcription termination/antitermination protein NusG [Geminicoccaceae bacterium]
MSQIGDANVDLAQRHGIEGEPPLQESSKRWYCVQTQPMKEMFAAKNLEMQSYQLHLPTVVKTIRHARKVTRVKRALFPSYLFVNVDVDTQSWWSIRSTFGVRHLIMENDRPKPVPIGVVEALITATNDEGHVDFRHDIRVGQNVRLLSGPFFNLVGKLERLDDRGRVAVLLSILGGERLVIAEKTALQPEDS